MNAMLGQKTFKIKSRVMKTIKTIIFIAIFGLINQIQAQDTFSIVAVDESTGEVGSAGATCLDNNDIANGALIISRIVPGLGAINTQSYWDPSNQNNATDKLNEGLNAPEIIDWLSANDVANTPGIRQYGVALFDTEGQPSAAGFTGADCFDVKLHKSGVNYSIQGNILLSEDIINDMESNFLNTEGSLAQKLMAAMQGANVPGADSRCLQEGVSSRSAFLRVARPDDVDGNFHIDLIVGETPFGAEPIDSLQNMFDEWELINDNDELPSDQEFKIYPNPVDDKFIIEYSRYNKSKKTELVIRDPAGKVSQIIKIKNRKTDAKIVRSKIPSGQYYYSLKEDGIIIKQSSFIVINK